MQTEERIKNLINYLEKRKRIILNQQIDQNNDVITFLDAGDLTRMIYSLNWTLQDSNEKFLGLDNV